MSDVDRGRNQLPLLYPDYDGLSWVSVQELDALKGLVDVAPRLCPLVLEVGTACGVTAALLAAHVPHATVVCVDTFNVNDDPTMADHDKDRWAKWKKNARPNMRLWYGTLREFVRFAAVKQFDLVFVDADHNLKPAYDDLMAASCLIRPGGVIAAHDFGNPAWPGVEAAVREFCRDEGFAITAVVGSLAILRKVP